MRLFRSWNASSNVQAVRRTRAPVEQKRPIPAKSDRVNGQPHPSRRCRLLGCGLSSVSGPRRDQRGFKLLRVHLRRMSQRVGPNDRNIRKLARRLRCDRRHRLQRTPDHWRSLRAPERSLVERADQHRRRCHRTASAPPVHADQHPHPPIIGRLPRAVIIVRPLISLDRIVARLPITGPQRIDLGIAPPPPTRLSPPGD